MIKQKKKDEEERRILEEKTSIKLQVRLRNHDVIEKFFSLGGEAQWSVADSAPGAKTRKKAKRERRVAKKAVAKRARKKANSSVHYIFVSINISIFILLVLHWNQLFDQHFDF